MERCQPERIILFGSQAYGDPDSDSDVDLLVVRRGIESESQSDRELRHAVRPARAIANLPMTLLTRTPERLQTELMAGSVFHREIVEKGVELYAASADE